MEELTLHQRFSLGGGDTRWFLLLCALLSLSGGCSKIEQDAIVVNAAPAVDIMDSFSRTVQLKGRVFVKTNSLIEIRYNWKILPNFVVEKDYKVAVHFTNDRGEVVWQDDHQPTPGMKMWQPGETISYSRVVMVPGSVTYPQISMTVGLYDPGNLETHILWKDGGRAVKKNTVMNLFVQPEEVEVFKTGWGRLEYSADGSTGWRWMASHAVFSFRNPRKICFLDLSGSTLTKCFKQPPNLTLELNDRIWSQLTITSDNFDQQIMLTPEQLGESEWVDIAFRLDRTFIPQQCGIGEDTRELGLMITQCHASENRYLDGIFPPERSSSSEWRWVSDRGLIETGNPKTDSILYLSGTAPLTLLDSPPNISIAVNGKYLETYAISADEFSRVIPLRPDQLGVSDIVQIEITTDQTFVPKHTNISNDERRLGFQLRKCALMARREFRD